MAIKLSILFPAQRVEDNPSIYLLSKPLSLSIKASRISDLRIVS